MKNITSLFQQYYSPVKALVVYKAASHAGLFIESYDMDESGRPINAHRLTDQECRILRNSIKTKEDSVKYRLPSAQMFSKNILHVNQQEGRAIWYTTPKVVPLYFHQDLGIGCGKGHIPALVWKAGFNSLSLFALRDGRRPKQVTPLYQAPFFNVFSDGHVCMGTVDIKIPVKATLPEFIAAWEKYFFQSYFTHLVENNCPVACNIVQLWQNQLATKQKFPVEVLKPSSLTLTQIV